MASLRLLALSLALALAGCAGQQDSDPDAQADLEAQPDGNETAPDLSGLVNSPPVPILTVLNATGMAPFVAEFTIVAEDAEMDDLLWAADFDGDGTIDEEGNLTMAADGASYEPVVTNFTFAVPGNFTATLTVGDPASDATATVAIAALPPVAYPEQVPYTFSGTITGVWAGSYVQPCASHVFAVVAPMASMTVTFTEGLTGVDLDYYLTSPGGSETARNGFIVIDNLGEPDTTIDAPELGDWEVSVCAGVSAQGTYTVAVTFA